MNWLVANTPPTKVYLDESLLTKTVPSKPISGTLHAVHSIPGQVSLFSILLENGAQISRIPIHWLAVRPTLENLSPSEAQLWNSLSYGVTAFTYEHLRGISGDVKLRSGRIESARYLFSIQYWGNEYADAAGYLGNKDCHILALTTTGQLVGYPNNRISWHEPAAVTPFNWEMPPKYKIIEETYSCEAPIGESDNDAYIY